MTLIERKIVPQIDTIDKLIRDIFFDVARTIAYCRHILRVDRIPCISLTVHIWTVGEFFV